MPKNSEDFAVGYAKPPGHTRFKKGRSGNPNGRPKGSTNFSTALDRALKEKVTITENGKRRTISKREATAKQLVNKAAGGDLRAIEKIATLDALITESTADTKPRTSELDRQVTLEIMKRIRRAKPTGSGDEGEAGDG